MVTCSMVAAAKAVKIPRFPDVHTTVLFKTAPIRHDYDRNVYPFPEVQACHFVVTPITAPVA
jgi:hypothetical protein